MNIAFKTWVKSKVHFMQVPWVRLQSRPELLASHDHQVIPRVVYQTGPNQYVNSNFAKYIERFRELNPEYRFQFATQADVHDFMVDNFRGEDLLRIFEGAKFGPMQADIYRYAVLRQHGGVYIDISKWIPRPLSSIIRPTSKFVLSHERNAIPDRCEIRTRPIMPNQSNLFVQWGLMGVAGHLFLELVLENIERSAHRFRGVRFKNTTVEILDFTATYMWTRSIWQAIDRDPNVEYDLVGVDFDAGYSRIPEPYILNPLKRHYTRAHDTMILR